ncbi:MAG TPA: hypothetical protein VLE97_03730 [Gaiellaceae bacterium]|nr:hypothetical protein [Gaiellaceae bacterium]
MRRIEIHFDDVELGNRTPDRELAGLERRQCRLPVGTGQRTARRNRGVTARVGELA